LSPLLLEEHETSNGATRASAKNFFIIPGVRVVLFLGLFCRVALRLPGLVIVGPCKRSAAGHQPAEYYFSGGV
ncbi:MAG: hypothetical protein E7A34_11655, partial [Leclercia adecarboxylata]|nr:hypothetical protein [Leclercia adecarboxylata]